MKTERDEKDKSENEVKEEKAEESSSGKLEPEEAEEPAEKVKPLEREKVEEEIVEERFYTIPLGKALLMPPNKRAPKAIRIIRDFVTKHMKLEAGKEEEEAEPKRLIISKDVNEKVWSRGIEKPPRKIRIRAAKDKEGKVTVYLAEGD
ncbi:MAG: 50S ribosomal protein L31e [Candidatus Bathyarchaeia archaeon]